MIPKSIFRSRKPLAAGIAIGLALVPSQLLAQSRALFVDGRVQGGYSTDPFLIGGSDTSSPYVELSISPQFTQVDEQGDAAISANYRRTEYLRRYDGTDGYGANARARRRLSQLLSVNANISYDSSILGQTGFLNPIVIDPSLPPGPVIPDITVLGLRRRQQAWNSAVGADWKLSQFDSLQTGVQVSHVGYGGDNTGLFSSRSITANAGYTRSLSARTNVGARFSGGWTRFGRDGFDGASYTGELTLHRQISQTIAIDAAAGILFIQSETALGRRTTTGFSGSLSACDQGERSTLCVRGYSSAQPTAFGDISKTYGAGADYSYRLNEKDTLTAGATFSRVDTTSSVLQPPSSNYFNVTAGYDRMFSRRISGGLGATYRRISGGFFENSQDDLNVMAYVRTRLGKIQ